MQGQLLAGISDAVGQTAASMRQLQAGSPAKAPPGSPSTPSAPSVRSRAAEDSSDGALIRASFRSTADELPAQDLGQLALRGAALLTQQVRPVVL